MRVVKSSGDVGQSTMLNLCSASPVRAVRDDTSTRADCWRIRLIHWDVISRRNVPIKVVREVGASDDTTEARESMVVESLTDGISTLVYVYIVGQLALYRQPNYDL